jgi:hypothetical protein
MKTRLVLIFCLMAYGSVYAQNTTQSRMNNIAGTYSLVLVDNLLADGSHVHLYGDHPHGILILDNKGNYSLQIVSEGRPNFKSNDKSKGTDEENRLAIKGSNAHFGTYSVDPDKHTITFFIAHASFPNWEGTKQVRPFVYNGSVFKYTVPAPTTGGSVTGEVVWKQLE